jgi:hypothetical protein
MPVTDLLIAIAQVGVSLAGFSGLIAAIRTTAPEGWRPRDIWSLSVMLAASIGALALALLPPWLALFDWPESRVFRVSNAIACVYIGSFLAITLRAGRALTRSGHPPRVPYFPSLFMLLLGVSTVATGAGAAGWLGRSLVAAFVGSLIALLLTSALVLGIFLVLLARATRSNGSRDPPPT